MHTEQIVDAALSGDSTATISAITVAEVYAASDMGDAALREKRLAMLRLLDVVAVDREIAERGGELRRQHNLALPDALIAACAEQSGGRFLSKDPHFDRLLNTGVLVGEVYS